MIATSKDRYSFPMNNYMQKLQENPSNSEVLEWIKYYEELKLLETKLEKDESWKKHNLEYDLRSSEYHCNKVRQSNIYSQNLYAALCNNSFRKIDIVPILEELEWSCSWRSAGGIVAHMKQEGDYIDWYCSGIGETNGYVPESVVTDEIREDLKKLGWKILEE
jgi:hypothetical protein